MAPTKETDDTKQQPPTANSDGPILPPWLNEDQFLGVVQENVPGFKKILKFDANLTGGAGENYASIMVRVKVKVQLEGGSTEDIAYMIKTIPQGEQGAMMVNMMNLFPKETAMYGKYLPKFEQIYRDAGKQVTICPKFYTFKNNPSAEYVLLEDLSPRNFKNVNRLEGLDKVHTESVLRNLAQLHAASAVVYETEGEYDPLFTKGIIQEESKSSMKLMFSSISNVLLQCLAKSEVCAKYTEIVEQLQDQTIDAFIKLGGPDPNDFNVLNHGDLWANNIMFRHNDEGKLEESIFVDFQLSRYGSPASDLFYFLISSPTLELKLSHFDYFVKYYHDHLVENLKLLSYPKKIPSLKVLRMQMLKNGFWAFSTSTSILPAMLLDPNESANIDNFVGEGEQGMELKIQMYSNPRYMKHIEAILPWLDARGLLDIE